MWNTYLLGGTPGLEHLILEWNVSVPPEGGANPPLKRFYMSPGIPHRPHNSLAQFFPNWPKSTLPLFHPT